MEKKKTHGNTKDIRNHRNRNSKHHLDISYCLKVFFLYICLYTILKRIKDFLYTKERIDKSVKYNYSNILHLLLEVSMFLCLSRYVIKRRHDLQYILVFLLLYCFHGKTL